MSTPVSAVSQSTKPTVWQIDPAHSAAHFSVRHLMISNVRGEFTTLTGTALIDPADLTKSKVEVTIETASINTREPQRDEHLRSADFFDAANHPHITFRSKQIDFRGPEHYIVVGDLTIRGTTKEVSLDVDGPTPSVKDPWGNTRAGLTASTKINRKDFGVAFNALTETGGVVVGDEVKISIEAELVQQAPSA
jgi:polyisoprenoid-binding protein YceI